MRTIYRAADGMIFKDKEDCADHENEILTLNNAKQAIEFVRAYCDKFDECTKCPLYCGGECVLHFSDVSGWSMDEILEIKE